jgi:hypothetical protein
MKYIITFEITDDFEEITYYHSAVCEENEIETVQQRYLSEYAPFIEVLSITPCEGADDSDYDEDDEAIPF